MNKHTFILILKKKSYKCASKEIVNFELTSTNAPY